MPSERTELAPGIVLLRHIETYSVVGSTRAQLIASLKLLGPLRYGQTWPAYTDWTIDWSYEPALRDDGWRVGAVSVTATITVTLPRWHQPSLSEAGLPHAWAQYLRAVQAHEDGHVALVTPTVRGVGAALWELPASPTLEALDALAHATVARRVAQHHTQDKAYDRDEVRAGIPVLHGGS